MPTTAVKMNIKINGSWFYHRLPHTSVTEPTALLCSPLICLELATSALRADLNPCTKSLWFQQKAADYKSVKVLALKGIFSITTQVFIVMPKFSTFRYIIRTQQREIPTSLQNIFVCLQFKHTLICTPQMLHSSYP